MTTTIRGVIKSATLDTSVFNAATGELGPICANKAIVDRAGEIIEASAWEPGMLHDFLNLGAMPLYHDVRRPVGRWTAAKAEPDGLYLSGTVGAGWRDADEARKMIASGALRAVSVGFIPIDGFRDKQGVWHHVTLSLLETSFVMLPMNQEAIFAIDDAGTLKAVELVGTQRADPRGTLQTLRRQLAAVLLQLAQHELDRAAARHDRKLARLRKQVDDLEGAIARRMS